MEDSGGAVCTAPDCSAYSEGEGQRIVCQQIPNKFENAKIALVPVDALPDAIPQLMAQFRGGSSAAAGKLVEMFYPELRRLAVSRMRREASNHTWQPTVLVNELYLELTKIKSLPPGGKEGASSIPSSDREAFLGLAAFLMRRLLIHHARPLRKRAHKEDIEALSGLSVPGEQGLQELEDLLVRLGSIDPRLRSVAEMKVFEGLSREEIAERLGCSVRTVARHWDFARHWLSDALGADRNA